MLSWYLILSRSYSKYMKCSTIIWIHLEPNPPIMLDVCMACNTQKGAMTTVQ